MRIWPAIDLRGGKCVRLRQGDYGQETVFDADPVAVACRWVAAGADCLHLVDLDGAKDGRQENREVIAQIVRTVKVTCQLGGGVRDIRTIESLFRLGLDRLVIGTRALREPGWFRDMCRHFPRKLVLGLDARDGLVATDGWLKISTVKAVELAKMFEHEPLAAIVYTDIARDGMMAGPNFAAVDELNRAVDLPIIASGGVAQPADVERLIGLNVAGCIIGRALYEGTVDLAQAIRSAEANEG